VSVRWGAAFGGRPSGALARVVVWGAAKNDLPFEGGPPILIIGPGEANGELKARLERRGLGARNVGMETVDRMTDRQIAARVREYMAR
jgi:hypothetical protein